MTGLSLLVVILFQRLLVHTRILFIFDTVGLALFVDIGIQKSLAAGYPIWVAIVMGIITGALGTACLIGGLVYWVVLHYGGSVPAQCIICAATVIAIRILAVRYGWSLPHMKEEKLTEGHN